jgi:predicted component of type VI protein secretion system
MFNPILDVPRVRVVEGTTFGDELLLKEEGREYVIGRGPKCDLVLDDREVSREHVKLVRRGFTIHIQDLSSTRGSWLGRAAVYTGATVEWTRPRMLRVGATVLSLDLPEAIRKAAPGAQASAGMTPAPRSSHRNMVPEPTPSGPPVSRPAVARGSNTLTPAPSTPPPGSPAALATIAADDALRQQLGSPLGTPPPPGAMPYASAPGPSGPSSAPMQAPFASAAPAPRKAWKKSGPTIGRASGLLLLALAGLVILGGLFVVFSLLE